jgi:hypothetical protein
MVISEPYTRLTDRDTVEVRARVRSKLLPPEASEELVFEYPARFADWVSHRADGFVAALVLRAMEAREPIDVRAPISERFASGLAAYQQTFAAWFPDRLAPVEVRAPIEAARQGHAVATMTAFSGGVDSFYTLWSHVPENEPEETSRITHALFLHGFDLPLGWTAAYDAARALYTDVLGGLGVDLIPAGTNLKTFPPRADWWLFHGGALIGAALVLDRGVRRFYVPAGYTYRHLVPWGTDPRVDPLLSTEALEVVHDGAEVTRVHKTRVIGRWPPTHGRLRVCARGDATVPNCCRCAKCLRTMITLELFGLLGRHTSFPHPLRRSDLRACWYKKPSDLMFHQEIFGAAIERRRWDVARDVGAAIARNVSAMGRRAIAAKVRALRNAAFRRDGGHRATADRGSPVGG